MYATYESIVHYYNICICYVLYITYVTSGQWDCYSPSSDVQVKMFY